MAALTTQLPEQAISILEGLYKTNNRLIRLDDRIFFLTPKPGEKTRTPPLPHIQTLLTEHYLEITFHPTIGLYIYTLTQKGTVFLQAREAARKAAGRFRQLEFSVS